MKNYKLEVDISYNEEDIKDDENLFERIEEELWCLSNKVKEINIINVTCCKVNKKKENKNEI